MLSRPVRTDVASTLENRAAVWSEGFGGVWHMADAKWTDSARTNHGTPAGGAQSIAAGKIGAGGSFGANNSNVDVGTDPSLHPTSITLSVWAQPQSVGTAPDRHPYMATQDTYRSAGSDPRGYYIEIYRTQTNPSPTFYTANGTLQVGGGGNGRVGSQYISRLLEIVGSGDLVIDYIKDKAIPRRTFHLVE